MSLLATPRPPAGRDAEVLIREARRRQRRRRTGLALVVAVVAVAIGWSASGRDSRPTTRRPPATSRSPHVVGPDVDTIPRALGTTLVLWGVGRSYVDNLTTRHRTSRAPVLRDIGYGDFQPLASVVGDRLLFLGNGLSSIGSRAIGQPRHIADPAGFFPASGADNVWLATTHGPTTVIRLRSLSTGATGQPTSLPRYTELVRGTDGGLLVSPYRSPGMPLELWRPGSPPRPLPGSPDWVDGFSATPRLVSYGTGCRVINRSGNVEPTVCSTLRVLDVVTGQVTSYAAPAGTRGWVPFEFNLVDAISPSGGRLAAVAAIRGRRGGRLYTVRIAHPHAPPAAVPGSIGSLRSRIAWSARGDWLLYQGPSHRLQAYQPASGRVGRSNTPCCQYTVMAAVPNRSVGRRRQDRR